MMDRERSGPAGGPAAAPPPGGVAGAPPVRAVSYLPGSGSEQLLLQGLRQGEVAAYRTLYDLHAPRLLRVVAGITGEPQLARDAVQETFAIVFRKIEGFDGRSSLLTWMTRICIREARRLAAAPRRPSDGPAPSASTPRSSPEEQTARAELYLRMKALIAALPEEKRGALLLFELEGFSVQEIAEITGEPYGTVLSRLSRTRLELRAALDAWVEARAAGGAPPPEERDVGRPRRSPR